MVISYSYVVIVTLIRDMLTFRSSVLCRESICKSFCRFLADTLEMLPNVDYCCDAGHDGNFAKAASQRLRQFDPGGG